MCNVTARPRVAGAAIDRLVGDGAYNWQIQFNLTFLRLISFCMDRFWSLSPEDHQQHVTRPVKSSGSSNIIGLSGVACDVDAERAEELRADTPLPPAKYSLLCMLAYVFYVPLYIAGPIVPFNTFARCALPFHPFLRASPPPRNPLPRSCMQRRQQCHTPLVLLRMLGRALVFAVVLDFSLHYLYLLPAPRPSLLSPPAPPHLHSVTLRACTTSSSARTARLPRAACSSACTPSKCSGVVTSSSTSCANLVI